MNPKFLHARSYSGTELFINIDFIALLRQVPMTDAERSEAGDVAPLDLCTFEVCFRDASLIRIHWSSARSVKKFLKGGRHEP